MQTRSSSAAGRMLLLSACLVLVGILSSVHEAHGGLVYRPAGSEDYVRIGVLGLFHPQEFIVSVPTGQALVLQAGEHSIVLENSGIRSATVQIHGSEVVVATTTQTLCATEMNVAGRNNEPVDFVLEIPRKITRRYHGTLNIKPSSGSLAAIVRLDLETAVASVVAAESASDSPPEALKALAVAARSYFVSGRGRHSAFDFCDTTHCQFLRAPPVPASPVGQAVEATRGLVLAYNSQPFAAMYTRACSGHTRTPAQSGLPGDAYPYFSVDCVHCRLHPARWTSRISAEDAALLHAANEPMRLAIDRRLGWSAVPSNDFVLKKDRDAVLVEGVGNGHGIGLCQAGARAMAESGAGSQEILQHYYPNTSLTHYVKMNRPEPSYPLQGK